MDQQVDRPNASQFSMGLTLVIIGLIFLGQRLEWGPAWDFARLWPIVLIGVGVVELALSGGGAGRRGYLWVFVGVIFLLDARQILRIRDSWPLFIVAAGVSLLFRRRRPVPPAGADHAQ